MKPIIYSSGENGYGLYRIQEEFPADAAHKIEALFNSTALLSSNRTDFSNFIRFSPLGDDYLLSIVFKGVFSDIERRIHSAAVNFLLNERERDEFFNGNIISNANFFLYKSADILRDRGYHIPEFSEFQYPEDEYCPSVTEKQAILSSVLHFAKAYKEGAFKEQTFLGIESEKRSPFEILNWLVEVLPEHMRNKLSFCLGAECAGDTYGTGLNVFHNSDLKRMLDTNNFSGGMNTRLLIYVNGNFAVEDFLDERVRAVSSLSSEDLLRLREFFRDSDNFERYLSVGAKLRLGDAAYDIELTELLGQTISVRAIEEGLFPDSFVEFLYKNRKKIANKERLLAAVTFRAELIKSEKHEKSSAQKKDKKKNKHSKDNPSWEKENRDEDDFVLSEEELEEMEKDEKKREDKRKKTAAFLRIFIRISLSVIILIFMIAIPVLLFVLAFKTGTLEGDSLLRMKIEMPILIFGLELFILFLTEVPLTILLYKLLSALKKRKK